MKRISELLNGSKRELIEIAENLRYHLEVSNAEVVDADRYELFPIQTLVNERLVNPIIFSELWKFDNGIEYSDEIDSWCFTLPALFRFVYISSKAHLLPDTRRALLANLKNARSLNELPQDYLATLQEVFQVNKRYLQNLNGFKVDGPYTMQKYSGHSQFSEN